MISVTRRYGGLFLAVLFGSTLVLLAPAAQAIEKVGWVVKGAGTGIMDDQPYSLYNTDQRLYLEEKDRRGANLSWTNQPNNFMKVKRQSGTGPIKCGEPFALFIEKEWVIYGKQGIAAGINITTRTKLDNPAYYQWVFTSCQPGSVIPLNQPVTLSSSVTKHSLVGCKRMWGVNLCWADDISVAGGQNYRTADIPASLRGSAKKWVGTTVGGLVGGPAGAAVGGFIASRGVDGTIEEEKAPSQDEQHDYLGDKLDEIPMTRAVPPYSEAEFPIADK